MDQSNPYQAPQQETVVKPEPVPSLPPKTRWRIIPTLLFGSLGGLLLLPGVAGIVLAVMKLWDLFLTNDSRWVITTYGPHVLRMIGICLFVLIAGCAWIASARAFWLRHWMLAAGCLAFGILCLAALTAF